MRHRTQIDSSNTSELCGRSGNQIRSECPLTLTFENGFYESQNSIALRFIVHESQATQPDFFRSNHSVEARNVRVVIVGHVFTHLFVNIAGLLVASSSSHCLTLRFSCGPRSGPSAATGCYAAGRLTTSLICVVDDCWPRIGPVAPCAPLRERARGHLAVGFPVIKHRLEL